MFGFVFNILDFFVKFSLRLIEILLLFALFLEEYSFLAVE